MGLSAGLLGLPNVGKSSLFNLLSGQKIADAQNYPFCTIDPNQSHIIVPDPRLETLAKIAGSQRVIPSQVEIVDIAGLVKGASQGEGLGNQFLGHVREVDALVHVVRCFENPDIAHVDGSIDPVRDAETIQTELMLADLASIEKRLPALEKRVKHTAKNMDPLDPLRVKLLRQCHALLSNDKLPGSADYSKEETACLKTLGLLTTKPVLFVLNVDEAALPDGNDHTKAFQKAFPDAAMMPVSVALEADIAALPVSERAAFCAAMGIETPGVQQLVQKTYSLLGLETFFTVGPKEARAWSFKAGATAPEAAAEIHTDFQKGFIAAEVCSFQEFVDAGGETAARSLGKIRREGKDYRVKNGDILHIRFNV